MGLQFMDGWPRTAMTIAGVIVIVILVATRQFPARRRRYRSAWEAPANEEPDRSPSSGRSDDVVSQSLRDLPIVQDARPFRRVPRTRIEAGLKALVFLTALAALALLGWMAYEFMTNLPGWS